MINHVPTNKEFALCELIALLERVAGQHIEGIPLTMDTEMRVEQLAKEPTHMITDRVYWLLCKLNELNDEVKA